MPAFDVVIVGAGAAGIAAARWLRANGSSALLLEARDRVGGRAHTDNSTFGMPLDRGCAWLHSATENPWAVIARDLGLSIIKQSPDWRRRVGAKLRSPEELATLGRELEQNFSLASRAAAEGRDVSMSELIPDNAVRAQFDAIMTWYIGIESDSVSSLDVARFEDAEINWAVREGLGSVVARAAEGLEVSLATPVQTIDWRGQGVTLRTVAGSVDARAVIVTAPTSVLAQDGIRFEPALPAPMQQALHDVPLGIANKVFFRMQPGALPYEGTTHFIGTDQRSHTCSYQVRPAGQEALLAYFGGRFAQDLEKRGELEQFALEELAGIFGGEFVRKITASLTVGWSEDPCSRGSYSAARPGRAHMREVLSQPIGERIFFAGEACSVEHFGTIHGAWESGVRAAGKALRVLQAGQ